MIKWRKPKFEPSTLIGVIGNDISRLLSLIVVVLPLNTSLIYEND